MKNVSCYCNSKLPKIYTRSGTFILKDGRYTLFAGRDLRIFIEVLWKSSWKEYFSCNNLEHKATKEAENARRLHLDEWKGTFERLLKQLILFM
jgi:hypothetical protein